MILIVEDIKRWEDLLVERTHKAFSDEEIMVVRSTDDLEKILFSNQKFSAVALDGWLGENSTLRFVSALLEKSQIVISTSQDVNLREEMISAGCQVGGNKWDFVSLLLQKISP